MLTGVLLLNARNAEAITISKANNTNDLNLSSSWVGSVPGTGDIARWNNTVGSANTTLLGADLSWAGIQILDPGGAVTIDAGNSLTLGASGVIMSSATQDFTMNNDVILGATQNWNVATSRTLTVNGAIDDILGTEALTKLGSGTLVLTGANTFSGGITVSGDNSTLQVIDTTGYVGDTTITHNGLGSGAVTLIGGILQLRANGDETSDPQTLSYGNDLIIQSGVSIDVNNASGVGMNKTLAFNTLTIGSNQLAVTGGNGYGLAVGDVTMLDSGAEFIANTGSLTLGALAWDDDVTGSAFFTLGGSGSGNAVTGSISEGFDTDATSLTKSGSSTWTLSGDNEYIGETFVTGGTLIVTSNTALGTDDSGTFVSNGATLHLQNNVTITGESIEITGDGAGPLQSTGDNTWTGNIVANTNSGLTTRITSNSGTLTLDGDLYSNNETGNDVIFVIGGSGTTVVNGVIDAFDEHSQFYRSASGNGTVILNAANTFTGNTVISGGAFQLGDQNALQFSTVAVNNNSVGGLKFSEGVGTFTIGGLTGLSIVLQEVGTGNPITLEVGNNDSSTTYAGAFSGAGSLVKIGSGTFTLTGNNSHSGSTSVNEGVLSFGSSANLGNGSATNTLGIDGGTLQYTGSGTTDLTANRAVVLGTGTATIDVVSGVLIAPGNVTGAGTGTFSKTGAGTLVLAGSDFSGFNGRGLSIDEGALSFAGGVGQAIDLGASILHLADNVTLAMEVGSPANFDSITSTGVASIDPDATIYLQFSSLAGITTSTYDLITAGIGSGLNAAGLTWVSSVGGDFQYQLNRSDTVVQLQTLAAPVGDAYWQGDFDSSWSSIAFGTTTNSNWATDAAGTTDRLANPGADATVYFSASNATGPSISTTLDNDFTINDLVFLSSPAGVTDVTIAQGSQGTLTINPSSSADGIEVQANAGNITISAPVELGASQTWNVSSTGASLTVDGVISGTADLVKTGSGTLTLSGSSTVDNTYTGLTTVSGGILRLNKSTNGTSIPGDLLITNGGDLTYGSGDHQIADDANITVNGSNSTFNGTGNNAGVAAITETIGSLTVTQGVVNAGAGSVITVTGATSFTGFGSGSNNTSTVYIGNSSSQLYTGSLSLTNMNGAVGTGGSDSFTVFGNATNIQTTLGVGSGGLFLENSNLYLNLGSSPDTLGSRLILDGDVTTTGGASFIVIGSGSLGVSEIELSSTAGTVTRTFNTSANLSIAPDINNGEATQANITKTGAATLTLSGDNSYTGKTQINGGGLSFASSSNLGDGSATNTLGFDGGTLRYTSSATTNLTANRDIVLGTGTATFEVSNGSGILVVSGDLTGAGTGTFTKTGAGTLVLAGNDFSGLNNRGLSVDEGALSFVGGAGHTVDLGTGVLHLADGVTLAFEVGSLANFDSITSTGVASIATNATINLSATSLAGITANTTYDLITAAAGSGFDAAGLTWVLSYSGSFQSQLTLTDTVVRFETLAAVTGDAYWQGDVSGSWGGIVYGAPNNTNWTTDLAGTTDRLAAPGADATVYFSTDNATDLSISTTLDNDFTINDLVFLSSPSGVTDVTIAQGLQGTLTINPSSSSAGIEVQDNAGTITISAPVELGASQTWNVSGTGASLTVSGGISGSASADLVKTGAGNITISTASSFLGRTVINDGRIVINAENRLGANPGTFTADQLTLDGGALQTTGNFAIDDSNRGITLGAAGGTLIQNTGTTLTLNNAMVGAGSFTKTGGGTLVVTQANPYTGDTFVLGGTLTIASGGSIGVASATAGSLQIAESSTATVVVEAGGDLKVGEGSSDSLLVGTRIAATGSTTFGTLDLSAATSFTANVGLFQVGGSTSTDQGGASGTARGSVTLATDNTIMASTGIVIARLDPAFDNTPVTSTLQFGLGTNDVTTPDFLIGGSRSKGTVTIASGGILNLDNGAGKTDLTIGSNSVNGTNTDAVGILDLTGGTLNATLGTLIVGNKDTYGGLNTTGLGSATGTFTLDNTANVITADSVILGNQSATASSSDLADTTLGTLNFAGGTFDVAGDVGLGIITNGAGALAKGVLNVTGGTFTVGGNITSTNSAKSTAELNLDGGTLDLTGGSIDANTFTASSGTLKNVSEIFAGDGATAADLTKTGANPLILAGTNSYTGATIINEGVLEVQGTTGTGNTTVADTATLAGAGTVQSAGMVTVSLGGTLNPGNNSGDAAGTLAIDGSLTLESGSHFSLQLAGNTPGANYDQVSVGGDVTLGGGDIQLTIGFTPSINDVFYVLLNNGANPIGGTFAGLSEGALVNAPGGAQFQITYLANWTGTQLGSFTTGGNDVALITTIPEPGSLASLALAASSLLGLRRFRRRNFAKSSLLA